MVVQSQEYEPGDVLERIDSFVESFESNLSNNLMEGKWETQVEVYRDTLQRKDTNLADKNSRLWVQISTGMDSQSMITIACYYMYFCFFRSVAVRLQCRGGSCVGLSQLHHSSELLP